MASDPISGYLKSAFATAGLNTADALRDDAKVLMAAKAAYALLPFPIKATLRVTLGKDSFETYALKFRDAMLAEPAAPRVNPAPREEVINIGSPSMKVELTRSKKTITGLLGGKKGDDYGLKVKVALGTEEQGLVAYARGGSTPKGLGTFVVLSDPDALFLQKRFSSKEEVTEIFHIKLGDLTDSGRDFTFVSPTIMSNFEAALLDGLRSVKGELGRVGAYREFEAEAEARAVKGGTETIEI